MFRQQGTGSAPASLHLKGAQAIGETFGVSRRTVRDWIARGAPIRFVGRRYQASYPELWQWLSEKADEKRHPAAHVRPGEDWRLTRASSSGPEGEWYVIPPCLAADSRTAGYPAR